MIDLRTFIYIDILQPQVASFLATVARGYLPIEDQASLFIEIAPGIAINRLTDVALKQTKVQPGMQIVERAFGILEVHSFDQAMVRAAGEAILTDIGLKIEDRMKPRIVSNQLITGIDPHHTMLINRMRHGDMILKQQTLFVLETEPAGYALYAANEAEKTANIHILEIITFGAFGRVYIGGSEEEVKEARNRAIQALEDLTGRAVPVA